jgi:hypothetical protein
MQKISTTYFAMIPMREAIRDTLIQFDRSGRCVVHQLGKFKIWYFISSSPPLLVLLLGAENPSLAVPPLRNPAAALASSLAEQSRARFFD